MASKRQLEREARKAKLYKDIGKAVRNKDIDLVEKLAIKLYKYQPASEKSKLKEHMTESQKLKPGVAYGQALADSILSKSNNKRITRKSIEESQKYFNLRMTPEERDNILAMKAFRKEQRRDYEKFRKLAKAPNSTEEIAKDLQYKGGNRQNGYKYEYKDKEGNVWLIISPRYDKKGRRLEGWKYEQTGSNVKPKDEDTVFVEGFYS